MSSFHLGGALPPGDPSYVARSFEDDIYAQVMAGNWVLLLGPRQHGKSSAIARLRTRLSADGVASAICDLQDKPQITHYRDILEWVATEVAAESLKPVEEPRDTTELAAWLEPVLPDGETPFVLFVDEASAIAHAGNRNLFYSQFRAIKNKQATAAYPAFPTRLRCVFVGTFRHQTMVYESDNSPFNVSELMESTDFMLEEAEELWRQGTGSEPDELIATAFEFVGGQPYLLQYIYNVIGEPPHETRTARFEQLADRLRAGEHPHTQAVFREVLADEGLRSIVRAMVAAGEGGIPNRPAQIDYQFLRVLGLAQRSSDNKLVFRNRLYSEIAATEFVDDETGGPDTVYPI